jgi:ATP-dependent DNA helicase PIF1
MIHRHPVASEPMSEYCQRLDSHGNRKCRFQYPKPIQNETTVDSEGRVHYRRRNKCDEMVVPYCLALIRKFQCHINFEIANTSHIFQYLFKYIHKGMYAIFAFVVWDECAMANRAVLACVEETCRRVTGINKPFGGKTFILLGDFKQTCPVIKGAARTRIVQACLKSSILWSLFETVALTIPCRNAEDPGFAQFVDAIGDGSSGSQVELGMIVSLRDHHDMINFVYPTDVIGDSTRCVSRAILAPTNAQVDSYNLHILSKLSGAFQMYYAADSYKEVNDVDLEIPLAGLDYAARTKLPGLPDHCVRIQKDAVYRLLRNLSIDRGLVKNVRVVIRELGQRIITVRLLKHLGTRTVIDDEDILIPRINFTYTLPSGFTLLRRQFPLAPAYATTFNSCQGLTLDIAGVDLTRPVFSHGQLYTALSRVRDRHHVRVLLPQGCTVMENIVYEEIIR